MDEKPTPTGITADRKTHRVTISWNTGKTCEYAFDVLRNACPCAQCRGGHENMSPEPDEDVLIIPLMNVSATQLVNVEAVGNYAVKILWGDGHDHGIYNWDYLYALCDKIEEEKKSAE